ncbi:hypothetical protein SDC9_109210 [bioreactor metagenome]|uniref:Uncharacterized protein n=1 Tax=bioreactor metagenome TaxID=1076179 RepID=A0A645BKL3_9ZZZZ
MLPTAATVAGPEPETAAKNIHTTTVTIASPPVILPRKALLTLSILRETPPAAMSSPAKMNSGMAISVKESLPAIICWTRKVFDIVPPVTMAASDESPMAIPTGTLKMRKAKRLKKSTRATISIHLLSQAGQSEKPASGSALS